MKTAIYYKSSFGSIVKIEPKELIEVKQRQYAQYGKAVHVRFKMPYKRKENGLMQTSKPYLVVLKGESLPEVSGMFNESKDAGNGMTMSSSRYQSFDERYCTDADEILDNYIAQHPESVVADYRHTKGYSSY